MPAADEPRTSPRTPWPGWLLRVDEVLARAAASNAGAAVAEDAARRRRWELEADVVRLLPTQPGVAGGRRANGGRRVAG